jgi:hypothetical protein
VAAPLPPSGHVVLRMPLVPGNSARSVAVRLHTPDEVLVENASVPAPTTLVGDPLVYRRGKSASDDPIAILWFSRRDRIRLTWPVLTPLSSCASRLLHAHGRPVKKRLTLDRSDPHEVRLDWEVPRLQPGDYLIELTATGSTGSERKLLATRVR